MVKTKIHLISGDSFVADLANNTKLTKNFSAGEMANPSSKEDIILELWPESFTFLDLLQGIRDAVGKPIVINSGFRTKMFNASLSGADSRSAHLHMCAADYWLSLPPREMAALWRSLCEKAHVIGAINLYRNNGYHVEAFSDRWYGAKRFQVRNYIGTRFDWK